MAWNGLKHLNCKGKIAHIDPKVSGQVVLEKASFENPIQGFAQVSAFEFLRARSGKHTFTDVFVGCL